MVCQEVFALKICFPPSDFFFDPMQKCAFYKTASTRQLQQEFFGTMLSPFKTRVKVKPNKSMKYDKPFLHLEKYSFLAANGMAGATRFLKVFSFYCHINLMNWELVPLLLLVRLDSRDRW